MRTNLHIKDPMTRSVMAKALLKLRVIKSRVNFTTPIFFYVVILGFTFIQVVYDVELDRIIEFRDINGTIWKN